MTPNKPNNKVEEIVKEFAETFNPNEPWYSPHTKKYHDRRSFRFCCGAEHCGYNDHDEDVKEIQNWLKDKLTSSYEQGVRDERERVEKIIRDTNHLIHESQKCQNRNGLFYCGECEQPYEECSCPARNSGARKMKQVILQALKNN